MTIYPFTIYQQQPVPMWILPLPICPYCKSIDEFTGPDEFYLYTCKVCSNISIRLASSGAFTPSGNDRRRPFTKDCLGISIGCSDQ